MENKTTWLDKYPPGQYMLETPLTVIAAVTLIG